MLASIGIETVILERSSREHVLGRVRAGVLEQGTVDLLGEAGAAGRLHAEGLQHSGISLAFGGRLHRIDLTGLTGGNLVTVYGQTEVTHDLMEKREAVGLITVYEAANVALHDFGGASPFVTYDKGGASHRIDCDFIGRLRKPPHRAGRRAEDLRAAISVWLAGRVGGGAAGRP